jgi:hypothetical protein
MASALPQLSLDPETAFFIVLKAREFHAKVEETDPDEGSNPTDDNDVDILEFQPDDAVQDELRSAIGSLNEDALRDLVALIWLGRGDFALEDWREAREGARDLDAEHVADYVMGLPLASTYLEDGLSRFGHSLGDYLDRAFAATREAMTT